MPQDHEPFTPPPPLNLGSMATYSEAYGSILQRFTYLDTSEDPFVLDIIALLKQMANLANPITVITLCKRIQEIIKTKYLFRSLKTNAPTYAPPKTNFIRQQRIYARSIVTQALHQMQCNAKMRDSVIQSLPLFQQWHELSQYKLIKKYIANYNPHNLLSTGKYPTLVTDKILKTLDVLAQVNTCMETAPPSETLNLRTPPTTTPPIIPAPQQSTVKSTASNLDLLYMLVPWLPKSLQSFNSIEYRAQESILLQKYFRGLLARNNRNKLKTTAEAQPQKRHTQPTRPHSLCKTPAQLWAMAIIGTMAAGFIIIPVIENFTLITTVTTATTGLFLSLLLIYAIYKLTSAPPTLDDSGLYTPTAPSSSGINCYNSTNKFNNSCQPLPTEGKPNTVRPLPGYSPSGG